MRLIRSVYQNRSLVLEMARREITDSHAGQMAGVVWLVVHPLLFFVVYAFLFGSVLKIRTRTGAPADYLIYLFSGLAPWLLTQDVMVRSVNALITNVSIVKKVMFPVEVLVAKTLVSSIGVQLILFLAVVAYVVVARSTVPATFLLLPFLLFLHVLVLWGIALVLSAITPYFRDISEFVRMFAAVNIYLMPVVYLPEMVPPLLMKVLAFNPFSALIFCYQDVLYYQTIQHPAAWGALTLFALVTVAVGSYIFVRLRHHFGSVL